MSYKFAVIDPRPFALEGELQKLAAMGQTLGAEVTVPAVANALTQGNIDPQHLGGDATTAAIEAAVTWSLPPSGTTVVTVRPDADSLGVMAVLSLREEGVAIEGDILDRVVVIAEADKHHSEWSPPNGLVTPGVFDALKSIVMDFKRPLAARVDVVREWLTGGDFADSEEEIDDIAAQRLEAVNLVEEVTVAATGRIAVIESTSRFAVSAAYAKAEVTVAVNPAFRFGGGEPHRKVTVCQTRPGLVDLKAVFTALGEIEPGWGGSPTIGGSPQGISSVIPTDEIIQIVEEHLL